jgi:hypothetical protein
MLLKGKSLKTVNRFNINPYSVGVYKDTYRYQIPPGTPFYSAKRLLIGKINGFVDVACVIQTQDEKHKASDNLKPKITKNRHNPSTS